MRGLKNAQNLLVKNKKTVRGEQHSANSIGNQGNAKTFDRRGKGSTCHREERRAVELEQSGKTWEERDVTDVQQLSYADT